MYALLSFFLYEKMHALLYADSFLIIKIRMIAKEIGLITIEVQQLFKDFK